MSGQLVVSNYAVSWPLLLAVAALVCLVVGYLLGASFSTRGLRLERPGRRTPEEKVVFLKGISSLLANDTDQAIKELTRAVELDSETVETYIALGHLFRTKGQFDRAVGIRQSIIARTNLPRQVKVQALFDLGVDYRKGGFLSRALEAFEQVIEEDPNHLAALTEMEQVLEELKEWDRALEAQRRIGKLTGHPKPEVMAHLKVARGKQLAQEGKPAEAKAAFKKALSWDAGSVDALLALGDLHQSQGEIKKALATWRKIAKVAPALCFLALDRVTGREWGAKEAALIDEFILGSAAESRDPRAYLIAAQHQAARGQEERTVATLGQALELAPCCLPAHQSLGQIHLDQGRVDDILKSYKQLLECLPGLDREFQCGQCGFKSAELFWKCPSCRRWGSITPVS